MNQNQNEEEPSILDLLKLNTHEPEDIPAILGEQMVETQILEKLVSREFVEHFSIPIITLCPHTMQECTLNIKNKMVTTPPPVDLSPMVKTCRETFIIKERIADAGNTIFVNDKLHNMEN